MKQLLQFFSTVFVSVLLLVGCSTDDAVNNNQGTSNTANTTEENDTQSEETAEDTVHIVISEDKGTEDEEVLSDEKVEVEEGDILLDVLQHHYDVEADDGFITSINGLEQDEEEGKFWMYDVNGEMAPVGANEYELSPGDEIEFDLQVAE